MQLIKSTGLVGHWRFDEKTGTVANDSGKYHNNCTFGIGTKAPIWADKGLEFNGVEQYIAALDSVSLNIINNITIEGWLNVYDVLATRGIISKRSWYAQINGYELKINVDNKFVFGIGDGVTYYYYEGPGYSNILPSNTWFHFAVTYDMVNVVFYLNGVNIASASATPVSIASNTEMLYIGGKPISNADWFYGKIDDLKLYDRALFATEIKMIYDFSKNKYT